MTNNLPQKSAQAFPLVRVGGEGVVVVVVVVMVLCPVFPVRDDKLVVMKGKVGEVGGEGDRGILAHFAHRVVAQRFSSHTGKKGLDNCGKKAKKPILAQELRLFAAAVGVAQQMRGNGCGTVESEK